MIGLPTCRAAGMPLSICCKNLYHILPNHPPCLQTALHVSELRPCRNVDMLDIVPVAREEFSAVPETYTTDSTVSVVLNDVVFRCKFNSSECIAHINRCRFNILPPCPHAD